MQRNHYIKHFICIIIETLFCRSLRIHFQSGYFLTFFSKFEMIFIILEIYQLDLNTVIVLRSYSHICQLKFSVLEKFFCLFRILYR